MSLRIFGGGEEQTHHHGLLAGASACTVGVLVLFGLILLVWHRVSGPVGTAILVVVWALMIVVTGLLGLLLVYAAVWVLHRVTHPEMMASRVAVRAKAAPAAVGEAVPAPAIPSPGVAALPAGAAHTHYHFDSAEAVRAALDAADLRRREPPA